MNARARRSNVAFTIVISVIVALCSVVVALLLATSGAPAAIVVGILLAMIPVGPLLAVYLWLDRYEPEPKTLLLLGVGWGATVSTSLALILQVTQQFTVETTERFSMVVVAPVTEEALKGLFILMLLVFRRTELDGILDGLVYAGMVGIGFAFTENILYYAQGFSGSDGTPGGFEGAFGTFIVRGIFSPFAHPFFTSFIGIGVGIAVISRHLWVRIVAPLLGYVVAVIAHAAWNFSASLSTGSEIFLSYVVIMVPAFLMIVGCALWARQHEGKVMTAALNDCARRGYLPAAEIPWLVRIPGRRRSRRHAMVVGGPRAKQAMKDYQAEAIELAYLHNRYLRGTAPQDFTARGHDFVTRMAALRPLLIWPGYRTPPPAPWPTVADVHPGVTHHPTHRAARHPGPPPQGHNFPHNYSQQYPPQHPTHTPTQPRPQLQPPPQPQQHPGYQNPGSQPGGPQ